MSGVANIEPQRDTDRHGCDFLEKLLDGAEVEWVALGEEGVGKFTRGGGLQKKDFTETPDQPLSVLPGFYC